MLDTQRNITFENIQAEIQGFLGNYPVTWIGRRPEDWQEDKFPQVRQDLSDAIGKCNQLMVRLEAVGRGYKSYAELQKKLLETRSGLQREFERYEMAGLGQKGVPHPRLGIKVKPSRRPPERVPEHLKKG